MEIKINPNTDTSTLPDFRNVGILMRVLLMVISAEMIAAFIKASTWQTMIGQLGEISAFAHPVLILNLVLLAVLSDQLRALPYLRGVLLIVGLALGCTALVYAFGERLLTTPDTSLIHSLVFSTILTVLLLVYFNLRERALSPALTEARRQALQARIRPHFLFNSMNAVLSLIRSDPKRAEHALEDMADLFRVMLADSGQLCSLASEVELCRQYLDLELLRLGDRLKVEWHLNDMPADALIPPLILQPLLENAVYHGIEPRAQPGTVVINLYRKDTQLHAWLRNPYPEHGSRHSGNTMALNNIRERLNLHFDAEASLTVRTQGGFYEVHIVIPYRKTPAAPTRDVRSLIQ